MKYYYGNKIKNEMGETYSINWRAERYIDIFNRKTEGNRLSGIHRCSLEDNIKLDLKIIRYMNVQLIYVAQDGMKWGKGALRNIIKNLWVPSEGKNYFIV
jgi:hypothetical protein